MLVNSLEAMRKDREDLRSKLIEKERELALLTTEKRNFAVKIDELLGVIVLVTANMDGVEARIEEKDGEVRRLTGLLDKIQGEKTLEVAKMKESLFEIENKREKERKKSASFYAEKEMLSKSFEVYTFK